MKNLPLYDLYQMLNENLTEKEFRIIKLLIKKREMMIETSATGGPSVYGSTPFSTGTDMRSTAQSHVGPVIPSNPPSASQNRTDWMSGAGNGDINTPFNPSGNNRIFGKTPMGKNHGAKTGKKSREKRLDINALRDILKQKRSTTMGTPNKAKKVMDFNDFLKNDITKVTKIKEGRAYKDTK